ncbi:Putative O-methyltransferase [bacterium HR37]|nr:Putative O-methyltransferase [bacterium HR37]
MGEFYIVNPLIERYLNDLFPVRDKVLKEMEELAERRGFPIIGPVVGRFLYQLVMVSRARRIFEMGSGFGYSAYWFAKALGDGGVVVCTELSEENVYLAREFFRKGGVEKKIRLYTGDAIEVLDGLNEEFDIIFNDIDKEYYPLVVDRAYNKLKHGGLFISDNVLWSGRILNESDSSPATRGIREFTKILLSHKGFITSVVPIRDGISLSIKV